MRRLLFPLPVLLLASAAFAQSSPRDVLRTNANPVVTATGTGRVSVAPDLAVLRLGAIVQDKDPAVAQDKLNEIMRKAADAIHDAGVKKEQTKTAHLSLQPVFTDYQPPRPIPGQIAEPQQPTIAGYRAQSSLELRITDFKLIPAAIDAAIKAGGTTIDSLEFQLESDAEPTQDALTKATQEAKAKADTMARALGLKLGTIVQVAEGNTNRIYPQQPFLGRALAAAPMMNPTPIEAGEIRVEAQVTVTYRLTE